MSCVRWVGFGGRCCLGTDRGAVFSLAGALLSGPRVACRGALLLPTWRVRGQVYTFHKKCTGHRPHKIVCPVSIRFAFLVPRPASVYSDPAAQVDAGQVMIAHGQEGRCAGTDFSVVALLAVMIIVAAGAEQVIPRRQAGKVERAAAIPGCVPAGDALQQAAAGC